MKFSLNQQKERTVCVCVYVCVCVCVCVSRKSLLCATEAILPFARLAKMRTRLEESEEEEEDEEG